MNITCVTKIEDLPSPTEWNRLAGGSPFRSWEWLGSWWETYGSDLQMAVLLIHQSDDGEASEGELVAIAPFYIERSTARGHVISFFGDGKVCSDYIGILAEPTQLNQVLPSIAQWLNEAGSGKFGAELNWDILDFDGVADGEVGVPGLIDHMGASSRVVKTSSLHTWTVPLPGSWDEYLAARSKRRRNQLRRIERDYITSSRAEVSFATTRSDVDAYLSSLIKLHTLRRQEFDCDGCFAHDRFGDFLERATNRLFEAEKLWMTQLMIDGEVAANSIGIREQNVVYLYQCGFDPKFSECKPGWIQNLVSLQQAVREGCESFDFLRGDEPYKSQLGGAPVELFRYRVAAPTALSRLRHGIITVAGSALNALPVLRTS